jgi:hypothetical protein
MSVQTQIKRTLSKPEAIEYTSQLLKVNEFRYNNRATKDDPLTDSDRFALAVSQVAGKRLT